MPPVYTLNAVQCPAIQVPASILNPAADPAPPLTFNAFAQNQQNGVSLALNQNSRRAELIAQFGGATGYGVFSGLDLAAGAGLSLSVAAGGANVDGPVVKPAATTLALVDNTRSWIWITSAGTLTAVSGNSLTPPTAACCCLGSVLTAAGAITQIDYSGRVELRGGSLFRRTADAAAPTDTPSATLILLARTVGGRFLWDGSAYHQILAPSEITSLMSLTGALQAPTQVNDANGNEVLAFGSVAAAVDQLRLTNAATGNMPKIEAVGDDANIGLDLVPQGTGAIRASGPLTITGALDHDGTAVGFYGVAPVARPLAVVQNDNVADRTLDISAATPSSGAYTGAADGEMKLADGNDLRVRLDNNIAAEADARQLLNYVVDQLQAQGLLQ